MTELSLFSPEALPRADTSRVDAARVGYGHAGSIACAILSENRTVELDASGRRTVRTALVRAKSLTTRDELVRGGDGKPRSTHRLCEVGISATAVDVVAIVGDSFDRVTFDPKDRVRVVERRRNG